MPSASAEQLVIRLTAAASSGQSVAEYVLAIMDERPAPSVDLLQVTQISSAVAVLAAIPGTMSAAVAEQRQAITQKIVDSSVLLTNAGGKTRLTTLDVLMAEHTLATAAKGLAGQRRDLAITRPANAREGMQLDQQ